MLGPNIEEAAIDLAAGLTSLGVEARFDPSLSWSERLELIVSGAADLVWLCGKLAVDLTSSGRMDAVPVAAPVFDRGAGPFYHSVVVASRPSDGLAGLCDQSVVWAVNEPVSWSGHHALLVECRRRGLTQPSNIVLSGSHLESIRMVASGEADAAAIDETVWRSTDMVGLFVVDATRSWPSPPLCAAPGALVRHPGLIDAVCRAGTGLRNVESLVAVSERHVEPIGTAMS